LNKITRTLYPAVDDNILNYLNDDGLLVEPIFYAPIIPMILVNGSKGIGTGFSTDIMCYNPLEIINYLKMKLTNKNALQSNVTDTVEFTPYYEGFKGNISKIADGKFLIKGVYEKISNDKIKVTELPIGYWTEDFKELLETLIEPGNDKDGKKIVPNIKDYDDMSKDTNVDFTITFAKGKLDELEKNKLENGCNGVEKLLKLFTTNTTSNMHLFDAEEKLKKYESVQSIIDDYYETRLNLYHTRKEYMLNALEKELVLLTNKAKYITEVLNGTIDLRKKKYEDVVIMLTEKGYDKLDKENGDYKYLTRMPMDSVTEENVDKLLREQENKLVELENIKNTTIYNMWLNELENLKQEYLEYKENRERLMNGLDGSDKIGSSKSKKKVVSKGQLKSKANLLVV
jgi:DNA topoisomerase-2